VRTRDDRGVRGETMTGIREGVEALGEKLAEGALGRLQA